MNTEKFETAVKNRANDRVQEKIRNLRKAVGSALSEFYGQIGNYSRPYSTDQGKAILNSLMNDEKKWPAMLWVHEEDEVRKELFSLMDEAQRALRSTGPKEEDEKPVEVSDGKP